NHPAAPRPERLYAARNSALALGVVDVVDAAVVVLGAAETVVDGGVLSALPLQPANSAMASVTPRAANERAAGMVMVLVLARCRFVGGPPRGRPAESDQFQ